VGGSVLGVGLGGWVFVVGGGVFGWLGVGLVWLVVLSRAAFSPFPCPIPVVVCIAETCPPFLFFPDRNSSEVHDPLFLPDRRCETRRGVFNFPFRFGSSAVFVGPFWCFTF